MTGEGKGGGKGEKVEDMYKASYHTAGKKYMYIFSMNPGKMVPGKNGPREKWSPEKWSPGNPETKNRGVGAEYHGVCVWNVRM